jgi:hypothetical protein
MGMTGNFNGPGPYTVDIPPVSGGGIGSVNQTLRPGFTPSRVIATGADGIAVAGGWGVSNGTLAADTAVTRRDGRPTLRATANAGAVDLTVRRAVAATTINGPLEFYIRTPRPSVGSVNVLVQWSATAPGADPPTAAPAGGRQLFLNNSEYAQGLWTCVKAHPAASHYATGRPQGRAWFSTETLPSTVRYVDIVFQFSADVPAGERDCWVDMVAINGVTKPLVVIGFDGGGAYANVNTFALPLFRRYGIQGYMSGGANTMATNAARCGELFTSGWDLIHQAQRSTNDYAANPTNLAADIQSATAVMTAQGWVRRDMLACMTMPSNSRSPTTDAIAAAAGIRCVGATGGGFAHSQIGDAGLMAVGRSSLNGNTGTGANAIAALDAAILQGSHLWYYGHDLVATVTDVNIQMLQSEFATFLAYAADRHYAGAIEIVTPSEFLRRVT